MAMISKVLAGCFAVLTFALGTSGANATVTEPDVFFTITSQTEPTLYFSVPQSPTPNFYTLGSSFELDNVFTEAVGVGIGLDNFTFYNGGPSNTEGGLSDLYFFNFMGGLFSAQLYTGPESSPTFLTGFFPATYTDPPSCGVGGAELCVDPHATIHISNTATTPLPSTWLMLLSGFLGIAFFVGRLRQYADPFAA